MPSPRSVLKPATGEESEALTAVVLGAGVAGLLSAHVACQQGFDVVLVEGDKLDAHGHAAGAEGILQVSGVGPPQYHRTALRAFHWLAALLVHPPCLSNTALCRCPLWLPHAGG